METFLSKTLPGTLKSGRHSERAHGTQGLAQVTAFCLPSPTRFLDSLSWWPESHKHVPYTPDAQPGVGTISKSPSPLREELAGSRAGCQEDGPHVPGARPKAMD